MSINPGEGYRLLDENEYVLEGDEWFHNGEWVPTCNHKTQHRKQDPDAPYRRKVEQPKQPCVVSILDIAKQITHGDRQAAYGPPDQDFRRTADMMNALFADLLKDGVKFQPQHVAMMMILIKLSRQRHQQKQDNWIDIAGYAHCGDVCDRCSSQENKS